MPNVRLAAVLTACLALPVLAGGARQPPDLLAAFCDRPAPRTAAGYEAAIDALNTDAWSGGDQSPSVALPDGRILWLYADTVQGAERPDGSRGAGSRFVRNSAILQTRGCFTPINGPGRGDLIPKAPNGDHYWPASATVHGRRLLVYADRARAINPADPFGFSFIGTEVAEFALPGPASTRLRFRGMLPTPSSGRGHEAVQWGRSVIQDGARTYLYGTQNVVGQLGKPVYVARAPTETLTTPSTWTYWTGAGWSPAEWDVRPMIQTLPRGWSYQFSVHRIGGRYVALTKVNEYFAETVSALTARSPEGPWVEQEVFRAPSDGTPGELRYSATAHPEVRLASGRLLVAVCRNNLDLRRVWADADLYKPDFFEVDLG